MSSEDRDPRDVHQVNIDVHRYSHIWGVPPVFRGVGIGAQCFI